MHSWKNVSQIVIKTDPVNFCIKCRFICVRRILHRDGRSVSMVGLKQTWRGGGSQSDKFMFSEGLVL